MVAQRSLRIGTRGSPLALLQAEEVKRRLLAAHAHLAPVEIEVVAIRTGGDRVQDRPLAAIGGKGLFTKEIEEALLAGQVDLAVHSMKDVPTLLPDGLEILCLPPRADPRDALLAPTARALDELPRGAVVGTSSLRRRAQLLRRRPDLRIVEFRGNVGTRLRKLADGVAEATLLAAAGLARLGHDDLGAVPLAPELLLPALAQGALGVEARKGDEQAARLLAPLDDAPTRACIAAERAFLAALDGSCRTPIAGLARLDGEGRLGFEGEILSPDGTQVFAAGRQGTAAEAAALGRDAARELRAAAGPAFFDALG
jgi:hydroxymethylbilane synthase